MSDELVWRSAWDLAAMIRDREVSPVEVVQAHLDRIDRAEPALHSFVTVAADDALREAKDAERAVAREEPLGSLHGIPVALKDEAWTKGVVSTGGSLAFARFVPDRDGTVAERVRAAGGIIIGKNNLPEFASWPRSKSRLVGEAVNPWDLSRISGASSGGSAACVAAGLAPLAVGSDGGGSIRIPSALCGVFGLYPSPGRVPCYGSFSYSPAGSLGPIARCVLDAALLQSVLAGPDPRDAWALTDLPPDVVGGLGDGVRGLRVGWSPDFGHIAVQEGVLSVVKEAMSTLTELGAVVEGVDIVLGHPWGDGRAMAEFQASVAERDWDSLLGKPGESPEVGPEESWMWATFAGTVPLTASNEFREFCSRHRSLLSPHTQLSISSPPRMADPDADSRQADLILTMNRLFERHDVLCSPTMSAVAPVAPDGWATPYPDPFMGTNFTFVANTTGRPAASVPCGLAGSLPVGMQVIGRPGDEATVLRVCQAFESARPEFSRPPDKW